MIPKLIKGVSPSNVHIFLAKIRFFYKKRGKMDNELKTILESILAELKEINQSVNYITENKVYDLHDVCIKIDNVGSKLDDVETAIQLIDIAD